MESRSEAFIERRPCYDKGCFLMLYLLLPDSSNFFCSTCFIFDVTRTIRLGSIRAKIMNT